MSTTTWEVLIAEWVDWLRMRGLAEGTLRMRRLTMRRIGCGLGAGLESITQRRVRTMFAREDWSPEYRKSMRATLASFCEFHRVDITGFLPPVKPPKPQPRPAPDDVWERLMRADSRTRLMARLAGEAGMRRAEVAALRTDDLIHDGDGFAVIVNGKGGRQRVVPVSAGLGSQIAGREPGWVFPAPTGGHLSPDAVGRLVSAEMPSGWSMHKLRHRAATRGYAATHDLRATQEFLGHASVATTQIYTAVTRAHVRAVSEGAAT